MRTRRACLLAALSLVLASSAAPPPAAPAVARVAPSLVLRVPGGEISLDSLRGKVVLVDFWASWCAPCQLSFPWLESMQEKLGPRGFEVVAISVDKSIAAAERFLRHHPASFTVAYDSAGRAAAAFGVQGMPASYVLGRDGAIRMTHVGFDPRRTQPLEDAVEEALAP